MREVPAGRSHLRRNHLRAGCIAEARRRLPGAHRRVRRSAGKCAGTTLAADCRGGPSRWLQDSARTAKWRRCDRAGRGRGRGAAVGGSGEHSAGSLWEQRCRPTTTLMKRTAKQGQASKRGGTKKAQGLRGWRVLVTRAHKQAGKLSTALRAQGAAVIEISSIEIRAP